MPLCDPNYAAAMTLETLVSEFYQLKDASQASDMSFTERWEKAWTIREDAIHESCYFYRRLVGQCSPQCQVVPRNQGAARPMINLASNDYLNFTQHKSVLEAASEGLSQYGAGAGSVPMLSGTLDLHRRLEQALAAFLGYPACLLFNSGFAANYGILTALLQKGDVVILDTLVHASILDGCGQAGKLFFLHNDMQSLQRALQKASGAKNKLVVVDGVYSMDGDLALLPEIFRLAEQHGAIVMVDDAHGTGVMGDRGKGVQHHFGLPAKAAILTGSFGKALAGVGGFACGSAGLIAYLEMFCRPFIFSSALPPGVVSGILKELELLEQGLAPLDILWENTAYLTRHLQDLGYRTGATQTPIIPVLMKDEQHVLRATGFLEERGVMANPVIFPVVPKNKSRLRLSLTAGLSMANLDDALSQFADMKKEFPSS